MDARASLNNDDNYKNKMPNYCYNYVKFTSDTINHIEDIMKSNLHPDLLLPVPEYIDDEGCEGWIENNYGSRWISDDSCDGKRIDNNTCEFMFITAWNPPLAFYENLLIKFQGMQLYYEFYEYNMGFCGYGSGGGMVYRLNSKTFYKYDNKQEYEQACEAHDWICRPFDPYFCDSDSEPEEEAQN